MVSIKSSFSKTGFKMGLWKKVRGENKVDKFLLTFKTCDKLKRNNAERFRIFILTNAYHGE